MSVIAHNFDTEQWKKSSSSRMHSVSPDTVIDAYEAGKKKGVNDAQEAIKQKLVENVSEFGKRTTEVLDYLKKRKFHAKTAVLRINNWNDFEVVIPVPEKEFLSDDFLKVYDFVSDLEGKIEGEGNYHVHFSFTEHTSDFDLDCLASDGFVLVHNQFAPKSAKKGTRKA